MRYIFKPICLLALFALSVPVSAQDDLLELLGEEEAEPVYTSASFKTTRVINGHSLENTAHGVLDFRINHRFGMLNSGVNELFGLDDAFIRLGLDYGITSQLQIGVGRSSFDKNIDGFIKYKILRQCDSGCDMPLTLAVVAASNLNTAPLAALPWYDPSRTDHFTHRLGYSFQLIVGRKLSESFTLQLNPGVVHRNLVATIEDPNDVVHVSAAARMKLTKRVAVNGEYFYVLPGQLPDQFHNSLSLGFDIETGGHVFQLHFTNSTAMFERGFITETIGDWGNGDIHFGFNISRVFTLHDPKKANRTE